MSAVIPLVQALLEATANGPASWPGVGVFHRVRSRRMPGFPRYHRLGFKLSPPLFRALNDGRPPSGPEPEGSTAWIADAEAAERLTRVVTDELQRTSRVAVPGLGTFSVDQRELGDVPQFFAVFRTDPVALRALNPDEAGYEAALKAEWPEGPPRSAGYEA